jgi:hypothetical protein
MEDLDGNCESGLIGQIVRTVCSVLVKRLLQLAA